MPLDAISVGNLDCNLLLDLEFRIFATGDVISWPLRSNGVVCIELEIAGLVLRSVTGPSHFVWLITWVIPSWGLIGFRPVSFIHF